MQTYTVTINSRCSFHALTSWRSHQAPSPVQRVLPDKHCCPQHDSFTFIPKHLVGTFLWVRASPVSDGILFLSSQAKRPAWILIRKNPNNSLIKLLLWSIPQSKKQKVFFLKKDPKTFPSLISGYCQHISSNIRCVSCVGKEKRRGGKEDWCIDLWCIKKLEKNTCAQTPSKLSALRVLAVIVPNEAV